ncbi:MAG TPA: SAM-dependent methyltransferase [Ktedonobacteraceae bacterium]
MEILHQLPSKSLQQVILERIEREGPITFAEYMRMALYEPGYGYYVTGPAKMGWEGDYYTSTDLSPVFAHCMGRQLQQMWEQLGQPVPFTVLEQGAGRGDLGREICSWAAQEIPSFHAALDYHSADIRAGTDAIHGGHTVNWVPTLSGAEALETGPDLSGEKVGTRFIASAPRSSTPTPAVILSNELVDAFPVHIVQKQDDKLYEIFIGVQDGHLYELLDEPSSQDVANYLDSYKIPWHTFEDGWRAEINLDALRWMAQTAQLLLGTSPRRKRKGFILTIDYGDTARKLYIRHRHRGTQACYFHHQFTDRPLARPGEQDLTAHVNFTALVNEGRRHGLRLQTLTTQRQWLTDMQMYEELEHIRQREFAIIDQARASDQGQVALLKWYDLRQRAMALTAAGGMGDFKVLILKR